MLFWILLKQVGQHYLPSFRFSKPPRKRGFLFKRRVVEIVCCRYNYLSLKREEIGVVPQSGINNALVAHKFANSIGTLSPDPASLKLCRTSKTVYNDLEDLMGV